MAQNYLYMIELIIDDLFITHPNTCAPDEYPTCVELTFQTNVFFSVCDKDVQNCSDIKFKNGVSCLFPLEKFVTSNDTLNIEVAKRKIPKCKFLLGKTEFPIEPMFKKITAEFLEKNPYFKQEYERKMGTRPEKEDDADLSDDDEIARQETFCPTFDMIKTLLSLYDKKGKQTGNMVIILRLSCMGPSIASILPLKKNDDPCGKTQDPCCKSGKGGGGAKKNKNKACKGVPTQQCQDVCAYVMDTYGSSKDKTAAKEKEGDFCSKYFSNNPCGGGRERGGGNGNGEEKEECGGCDDEECDEEEGGPCSSAESFQPCFICPTPKEPGPEAYDEFEAAFNGSGLTIRVLKNSHMVADVCDSDYGSDDDEARFQKALEYCRNQEEVGKRQNTQNFLSKNMGGRFSNIKNLPKIRGNLKYRADEQCGENFEIPFPIQSCDEQNGNVNKYRKQPLNSRNCCLQVDQENIEKAMKGLPPGLSKPDGLEVCQKKCVDEDTDVFVMKLGQKKKCHDKEKYIEIELRTPKVPYDPDRQKKSTWAQVTEKDIDESLGKGKGGGKGKKK